MLVITDAPGIGIRNIVEAHPAIYQTYSAPVHLVAGGAILFGLGIYLSPFAQRDNWPTSSDIVYNSIEENPRRFDRALGFLDNLRSNAVAPEPTNHAKTNLHVGIFRRTFRYISTLSSDPELPLTDREKRIIRTAQQLGRTIAN